MSAELSTLRGAAEELAYELLAPLGNRWRHTAGVAARAAELATPLEVDREVLVAAAWLHDIGYSDATKATGFHPLDGAVPRSAVLALADRRPGGSASGARFVAAARGLAEELAAYPDEGGEISDALTYADQTVGPDGRRVGAASATTRCCAGTVRPHGTRRWIRSGGRI